MSRDLFLGSQRYVSYSISKGSKGFQSMSTVHTGIALKRTSWYEKTMRNLWETYEKAYGSSCLQTKCLLLGCLAPEKVLKLAIGLATCGMRKVWEFFWPGENFDNFHSSYQKVYEKPKQNFFLYEKQRPGSYPPLVLGRDNKLIEKTTGPWAHGPNINQNSSTCMNKSYHIQI